MKILFLVPYPLKEAPSQRFRFEQYFDALANRGYFYQVQSFLDSENWRLFFGSNNTFLKIILTLKGFGKRLKILREIQTFDFVFIHREASPVGPPVFEWLIAKVFKKKIIYDFDDAIWLTDRIQEPWLLRILKWRTKVKSICRWSYKISCGNDYLVSYAHQFNKSSVYNPTTIDTNAHHNPDHYNKENKNCITIGWTGSHSTLKYLTNIEPAFQRIEKIFPSIRFIIIADLPAFLNLNSIEFIPWSLETEIIDLYKIDIGIMPLPNDEWSKGKCGFKAIQYMSLQIPVVASRTGVNPTIIDHGVNGFLAGSEDDWVTFISQLITDENLSITLGRNGRKKIIESYSVASNEKNFVNLFTS